MKPQPTPYTHPTLGIEDIKNEVEMAQALRIARRTFLTLRLKGEVPCLKLGRQIEYLPGDVMAALKRNAPKF